MATDGKSRPTRTLTSAQPDKPAFRDGVQETGDRASLGGAPLDHSLADHVAAVTETPLEASIDARMGLRGAQGRTPQPEDFVGVLSPEGNSGDIAGTDVSDSPFAFGEDGSTRVP
jgi:hypothetical protein